MAHQHNKMILLSVTGEPESRSRCRNGGESIRFDLIFAVQPSQINPKKFCSEAIVIAFANIAMLQLKAVETSLYFPNRINLFESLHHCDLPAPA